MNIKMVGLAVVIAGVSLCVMFFDSYKYMVAALTVVVFGFLIALIGYLSDVKKQKIINDRLDDDIERVIQPLITKYSNLNKQYSSQYDGEEYWKAGKLKRLSLILVGNKTNYNFFSNKL